MSENNTVYEITRIMNDKPAIQNDMNEAARLVQKMFEEKYILKINSIINSRMEEVRKKPSREINLLQSFKAFMPELEQKKMEKIIDTLFIMEMMSGIKNEYSAAYKEYAGDTAGGVQNKPEEDTEQKEGGNSVLTTASEDESVHHDGVYDIDSRCMVLKDSNKPLALIPMLFIMRMFPQ
jgi:hypothetical protein